MPIEIGTEKLSSTRSLTLIASTIPPMNAATKPIQYSCHKPSTFGAIATTMLAEVIKAIVPSKLLSRK